MGRMEVLTFTLEVHQANESKWGWGVERSFSIHFMSTNGDLTLNLTCEVSTSR